MNVEGKHYRTIWPKPGDPGTVQIIDQTALPHALKILDLTTVQDVATAIRTMQVRGAGLIGAAAGYGVYLAALRAKSADPAALRRELQAAGDLLKATRPTAVNLAWAVERQLDAAAKAGDAAEMVLLTYATAQAIADEDAEFCRRIGEHGLGLIEKIVAHKPGESVQVLTHCNAGWLAFVDHGSATAPLYAAFAKGISLHVWVDETRPRNQGSSLTAWELLQHGVPHTVIADNTGGHLMQRGLVDIVIVGSDRTTYTGDVGNKVGTYLKALAAADNGVPFYAALPSSTFDWTLADGVHGVPIEERDLRELTHVSGLTDAGAHATVRLTPVGSPAKNIAFDVTPRRLVTGLITERGICPATEAGILALYPERAAARAL